MPYQPGEASGKGFPGARFGKTTKRLVPYSVQAFVFVGISACFVIWASLFIYNSSFVGIDGRRYFCLIDDAMISMRYAWNLSHGLGLVWNPGEYVEGYTNPLMTLLMSLPTLVFDKVDAVLTVQIFGIIFMLANAYLVILIGEHLASGREHHSRLFRALAFLCGLSYYPLIYWSLMGMETGMLAVFLSLSLLSALKYARNHTVARGMLVSVSLGLAFLIRPDTVVLAVPIFVYAFFAGQKPEHGPSLSFLLAMVGLYAVFIVGQELFRWGYYGEWLPNTYTLKVSGIPLLSRVENGTIFVAAFLKDVYVLLSVVGVGLVFSFRKEKLFLTSVFVVMVCYQVWAGGDMSSYWRLPTPAMPIMLVLGAHEILTGMKYLSERTSLPAHYPGNPAFLRRYVLGFLTCFVVLGMIWSVNSLFLPEIAMLRKSSNIIMNEERINTTILIERFTTPDATVGVFDAGAIPYYTGRPAIDFLGKADRYIAQLAPDPSGLPRVEDFRGKIYDPGHNKYDLDYSIKELRPTYVRGFAWGGQNILDWAQSEYVTVVYEGVRANFLKDSEYVRWDDIEAAREAGKAALKAPTL